MKLKSAFLLTSLSLWMGSCAEKSAVDDRSVMKPSARLETPSKPSAQSVSASTAPKTPVKKKIRLGEITGIDMGRVFTMQQAGQVLLVDCRPPIFYRLGHLDGAINLPLKSYDALIQTRKPHLVAAISAHKTIVLYCQNTECPDAYGVAKKLVTLGYSVSIYKGGWEAWKRAGL